MTNNLPPRLKDYEETRKSFSWLEWHKNFSWHETKKVNYAYEVTNAQIGKFGGNPAIVTQGPDGKSRSISFADLAVATDKLASFFKSAGLQPGERFALYAPRSIEYALTLLGSIKAGAIVVPLFDAFGSEAIEDRLNDCQASWIFTTKKLVSNVNFKNIPSLKSTFLQEDLGSILDRTNTDPSATNFGDLETPFIIHYTSGSTAKPKGILLANRAMIGHLVTAKYVLDLHPEDKYWNTGDPGWVTGMIYNFFAPLLVGATVHIYEGAFHPGGWVNFMKNNEITVWYSTPTAFRLLRFYNAPLNISNLLKLRHIVSAGEPLNQSLIDWTMKNLGIPIHDSWYMTENGHQLINNYRCLPIKRGSMGRPLPGITAAIIDEEGNELPANKIGRLAIKIPWPGLMKAVWNDPVKFQSYFQKDWYISGDIAYRDDDGYFWFQGREDDMIKSAAERVSPFEIESALVAHPAVAEAGVIGKPHELYGSIIKAFVVLKPGFEIGEVLKSEIVAYVRQQLSFHEAPREIEFVNSLPKTKSGKIMRRVLRAKETNTPTGDLSTIDSEMTTDIK